MLERGDMFWNRKSGNAMMRAVIPLLFRFARASRFTPDQQLTDGQGLGDYRLDATVVHLPGHSRGSIGILTAGGDLFCGDLIENTTGVPALGSIVDDRVAANASIERLARLKISTVCPGHGQPFEMAEFTSARCSSQGGARP